MKFVLLVSNHRQAAQVLKACFKGDASVVQLRNKKDCINWLLNRSCELIFIDIEELGDPVLDNGYKPSLQAIWHANPSAEVVVMAPPHLIRNCCLSTQLTPFLQIKMTPLFLVCSFQFIPQPVAFAIYVEYLRVMDKSVYVCCCDHIVLEYASPVLKVIVGGKNNGSFLVTH